VSVRSKHKNMPTSRERRWILPKRRVGTIGGMNESKMIRSETGGNKGMEEIRGIHK
jgi:hypothetical protein